MDVLNPNYLDKMSGEFQILNLRLDALREQAIQPYEDTGFTSLFESSEIDFELEVMNEEAYDIYMEAVSGAVKKIWRVISNFIKELFTRSGNTISGREAKSIIKTLQDNGDLTSSGSSLKNMVQKGFYIIAGLGTSYDAKELKDAYYSGNPAAFVTKHIRNISSEKIDDGAKFRICIGMYADNIKTSIDLTHRILNTLAKSGIQGVKNMGNQISSMNESIDEDAEMIFEGLLDNIKKKIGKKNNTSGEKPDSSNDTDDMSAEEVDKKIDDTVSGLNDVVDGSGEIPEQVKKSFKEKILGIKDGAKQKLKDTVNKPKKIWEDFKKSIQDAIKEKLEAFKEHVWPKIKKVLPYLGVAAGVVVAGKITYEVAKIGLVIVGCVAMVRLAKGLSNMNVLMKQKIKENKKAIKDQKAQDKAEAKEAKAAKKVQIRNQKANDKEFRSKDDHLSMATIAFMNEGSANANAKIRLYSSDNHFRTIDLRGQDNVLALRNDLLTVASDIENEVDLLPLEYRDDIATFGECVNLFFAGMVDRV